MEASSNFRVNKRYIRLLKVSEDAKLNAVSSPDTLACPSKIFARRRREPFNFMTCQQEEVLKQQFAGKIGDWKIVFEWYKKSLISSQHSKAQLG